jgi:hypothetical protein
MLLARDKYFHIIIAGRSGTRTADFCAKHGFEAVILDTSHPDFAARLAGLAPRIVVDATGPFQGAGLHVAQAALGCGAHYLDLSDDAAFTNRIATLDAEARAKGITVLSGVSTVPALSSVVAAELIEGIADIHLVESTILPGNRAPRGLAVIEAITTQVGQPMTEWRGGRQSRISGWTALRRVSLNGRPGGRLGDTTRVTNRWASVIGAPDLVLFPSLFETRSVRFFAGLELRVMHGGLAFLAGMVRLRLLRSVRPLSRLLKWAAGLLYAFGSDRGGMRVRVQGLDASGKPVGRDWVLIAGAGEGPFIPAIPAYILCRDLIEGRVPAGARPCLKEFSVAAATAAMQGLDLAWETLDAAPDILFRSALGPDFDSLPPALRDLHSVIDRRHWAGRASITRGSGIISRCAAMLVRFPPAATDLPVQVTMERVGRTEVWTREFGSRTFSSHLEAQGEGVTERFGLLTFRIALKVDCGALTFPVTEGRFCGIPIPRALLPRSDTREYVDGEGRACFDVGISLPVAGHVIRYAGWLAPAP